MSAEETAPIENAVVSITNFDGVSTHTNKEGLFVIPALPDGTYTISVSAAGYHDAISTGRMITGGRNFNSRPDISQN